LHLTKMACQGRSKLETNTDILQLLSELILKSDTRVIIMNAAICDYFYRFGSKNDPRPRGDGFNLELAAAPKIIQNVRSQRKDIFLVGFKNTIGPNLYKEGLGLLKSASCNLVFANDPINKKQMIVCPEESHYASDLDRDSALEMLVSMIKSRTQLNFTRSTVVAGELVSYDDAAVPFAMNWLLDKLIISGAYKPIDGKTAGHFAIKIDDNEFLTSIRKSNFITNRKLVRIKTDGPDSVIAYGAKPSVGGQSQRIVFDQYSNMDCIVHFHCPIRAGSAVPIVSQKEFECGSHECGRNTADGLKLFELPNCEFMAVHLDNHGPNIVFNSREVHMREIWDFINQNWDLSAKTGGYDPSWSNELK